MRFFANLIIFALLASATALAQDAHKCKLPDGRIIYQDQPCTVTGAGTVRVVRTNDTGLNARTEQSQAEKATESEIARLKGMAAAKEKKRILSDKQLEIDALEREINHLQDAMQADLSALSAKKSLAKNNLAGATWEASISSEMQATTQRYNTEIAAKTSRIDRLRKDIDRLK